MYKKINTTLNIALIITFSVMVGLIFNALFSNPQIVQGSAPSGLPSNLNIATTTQVGPQETNTLFTAKNNCASRIVRTQGQAIILGFADPTNGDVSSTTISSVIGFIQAASTTVAYDSGVYGCGRVTSYAEASTTLTTMETI